MSSTIETLERELGEAQLIRTEQQKAVIRAENAHEAACAARDDAWAAQIMNPFGTPHGASDVNERKGTNVAVTIKPLEDRILVQPLEAEQTTASGLVIPETAKEKPQEGKVLAVGPGRIDDKGNRVPLDVAEGDVVIFSKYGGTEVKYNGEEYLLLNARDILAVVTK